MLLSHNFNIQSASVLALSRSEFTAIFQAGMGADYTMPGSRESALDCGGAVSG
jgi:hypothetical protein